MLLIGEGEGITGTFSLSKTLCTTPLGELTALQKIIHYLSDVPIVSKLCWLLLFALPKLLARTQK